MPRWPNRVKITPGDRYGKLVAIREVDRSDWGTRRVECLCDCGTIYVAIAPWCKGGARSCSCAIRDPRAQSLKARLPMGEAAFNRIYARYEYAAKKKGRAWNLTPEVFREITKLPCHYCGVDKSMDVGDKANVKKNTKCTRISKFHGTYSCNGVDRIDSEEGYEPSNCVPCCMKCNRMKLDLEFFEFIDHVSKISIHLNGHPQRSRK